MTAAIDPQTFLHRVRPLLERNDADALIALIHQNWAVTEVAELLQGSGDARKVALVCLSLVGNASVIDSICPQLKDPESKVNELAEHALWSIWFRSGSKQSNSELCQGARALSRRQTSCAIEHFDNAIAQSPDFAEPYNQRAIARFVSDEFELSIADCRRATRLMPCHFGAWAGMGHCFVHLGQFDHALRAYDRALELNPHMHAIAQSAAELRNSSGKQ